MNLDPAGLYARLEVDPATAPDEIAAAFRRKARVLHPDVVGTGDAEAFIRVKEAYDVLGDPLRRAAYDRAARAAAEEAAAPAPIVTEPVVSRGPRFSDLPVSVWAGLGGLFLVAAIMAVVGISRPGPPAQPSAVRPFAPSVPPAKAPEPSQPPTALTTGPTTFYVRPGGEDAVVWRMDSAGDRFVPVGQLAAFSPVLGLRLIPQHGVMEIRLPGGTIGFVDANRLEPGDSAAAHRAYCAYNAGAQPQNGEVLRRHGTGAAALEIRNRGNEPVVVKLRDAGGDSIASVFVAPGAGTRLADLPETGYRLDFAEGELWSRACSTFAAGMRAQRLAGYASPSSLSPLTIPPDLSVTPAPEDIPDAVFERD